MCILPADMRIATPKRTALINGTDLATVAELRGHTDLKMIGQHYHAERNFSTIG